MTMSSSSKMHNQHGRSESGNDPYAISYRDAPDRSRRSLSPQHKLDGSRRILDGYRTNDSSGRRDYGFYLGGGKGERVHSKSPQYGIFNKRDNFEDGVVHRKYGYREDVDFDQGTGARLKQVYGYDHGTSRASEEKDYSENRIVDIGGNHGMLNQKSVPVEDDAMRGMYRLPSDVGPAKSYGDPTKSYGEPGGSVPLSSRSMDVSRVEHERLQYREPIPLDKLAVMESYKGDEKHVYRSRDKLPLMEPYREGEKPVYHSGDVTYPTVPSSHSKDILSTSRYKDYVSTSSGTSLSEFSVSYRDGVTLPATDGYSRGSVQLTQPIGSSAYGQRSLVDTMTDAEAEPRSFIYNQRVAYSPSRTEREDYIYAKTRMILSDDQGYPSDGIHRRMSPRIRHDYDHSLLDYNHRDLSRPSNVLPVVDGIDNTEQSDRDLRKSNASDHPALQKQTVSDYFDMSRKSYALKQGEEYTSGSTHVDFEREVPGEYGVSQDRQVSYPRSDYGFGRGAGQDIHKEIFQSSSNPLFDSDRQNLAVRTHRIEQGLGVREPYEKVLKRKNNMDDDIIRHDNRIVMSSKWQEPEEFKGPYDSDECFDEDMSGVKPSKTRRFNNNEYRKGGRTHDEQEQYENCASDVWFSSQDTLVHSQSSSIRFYKNSGKFVKAKARLGSLSGHNSHHGSGHNSYHGSGHSSYHVSGYNSYHVSGHNYHHGSEHNSHHGDRSGFHKQHKVWKRIEDYNEDLHENDGDTSEDWSNLAESEPSEDTEEFKELVHKAFVMYSKKLNVNPSVRRRYKEQGKAGSLFCIACGRSLSKDFMNTQSLVRHAFMSLKVGLRTKHLGLQKAICVLMGWNSVVPDDMITWVPEVMLHAEAMAQKEDLILWPPIVVIRNISMSNNNPKEQKVIPIDGVGDFLRGKGIVGGKMTFCLGRPADQSVMVVKFLGTFSGLGNAEKLHKYFAEHKHGREEFVRSPSNNSRNGVKSVEAGMQGDKLEEQLLYGYMGISEDLDSVDFNTKKYCLIKSKKEILDLANAPVKPDAR